MHLLQLSVHEDKSKNWRTGGGEEATVQKIITHNIKIVHYNM
jgi:hypothetical protein